MTIGDRVLVTYTNGNQREGTLVGETEKQWKVDFDGEEKRVSKKMQVEVVTLPGTEDVEVEEDVVEVDESPVAEEDWEDVEEPTEEEFEAPVGEPKSKKALVVLATVVLVAIAGLIALRVLGVL